MTQRSFASSPQRLSETAGLATAEKLGLLSGRGWPQAPRLPLTRISNGERIGLWASSLTPTLSPRSPG
jgi:hypothetical protein